MNGPGSAAACTDPDSQFPAESRCEGGQGGHCRIGATALDPADLRLLDSRLCRQLSLGEFAPFAEENELGGEAEVRLERPHLCDGLRPFAAGLRLEILHEVAELEAHVDAPVAPPVGTQYVSRHIMCQPDVVPEASASLAIVREQA